MKRSIGAAIAALTLALAACGGEAANGDTSGAEEAQTVLKRTVSTLVEAAAPGADTSDMQVEKLTCTDSAAPDRVMFRITHSGLQSPDTGTSLRTLETEIQRLGMFPELDTNIPAQEIGFRGNGLRGNVAVRTSGAVQITASTECHEDG